MPLEEITKKHVIHMLNQIGKRPRAANSKSGGAVQMNRTFSMVRAIFNWAVSQARLESSPLDGMKKPRSEDERERVLSDDEIRWFWGACDDVGYPFGHVGKLLLSTLQRRSEVSDLPWPELDLRNTTWNIPGPRTKNKNAHIVHLSTGALRILKNTPLPHTGFVFTTLGDRPVSGFAKAKELLDQAMLIRRRRELGLPEDDAGMRKLLKIAADKPLPIEIPEWTYHDLRRTGTTKMAGKPLKVPPHVVDKILNHSKGTIRGVAKIYNREEYLEERAEALDAWSAWLDAHMRVQKAKPSKVVRLRG
jgi:integrase